MYKTKVSSSYLSIGKRRKGKCQRNQGVNEEQQWNIKNNTMWNQWKTKQQNQALVWNKGKRDIKIMCKRININVQNKYKHIQKEYKTKY